MADTSKSCSYTLFLNSKARINSVCILSIINQMHNGAININSNFWAISTLQYDKKYITCLQFRYIIKLQFPMKLFICLMDIRPMQYLSYCHPTRNLHVESSIKTPQYKLGFNRSSSKISIFNLMQSLNLSNLIDDKLQDLAHKIQEMKQVSNFSINSTSTKLRTYSNNFWSSIKVKINHRYFGIRPKSSLGVKSQSNLVHTRADEVPAIGMKKV